jgi:predicted amidohydrolase
MRRRWFLLSPLALAAQPAPVRLKVAAVQFRSSYHLAENLPRILEHLYRLAAQGVQVAVFPECALTGYDREAVLNATAAQLADAETVLGNACRQHRIAAIVGSVHKTANHIYNVALVIDSQGRLIERYAKVYLAGERWFTPGNHIAQFDLEGVPSTVIICHDERYPELTRLPAIDGARVVYYISHESPIELESKIAPYRAQLMARAVENNVHIVAANAPANRAGGGSHGHSRIVLPDGNILREAGIFTEETLVETLEIKPGKLTRPLEGALESWWRSGVEWMRANRSKPLD